MRATTATAFLVSIALCGCSKDWDDQLDRHTGRLDAGPQDGGASGRGDASLADGAAPGEPECDETRPCREGFECVASLCVFVPPPRVPSAVFQSNGGGLGASSSYRIRWSVGMPQPFGKGTSSSYHLTAGPGAGRP